MKLLIEQELFAQCIKLLDNIENDNNCIPKHLWDDRNRILSIAHNMGYEVYNGENNNVDFNQKI